MREHDDQTIATFVTKTFALPAVQKIVESWRVDPAKVIEMLIDHFKDMGILRVPRKHHTLQFRNMVYFLKHSPELQKMVTRTNQDELRKQRTRHAD